jgi:RNase P/RNase MRP subunit POP5
MPRRYVLVRVLSKSTLSAEQFEAAFTNSIRLHFGEFGLARIAPRLVRFDSGKSEAIVACNREGTEDLQAAIGLISDIPEAKITAITIRVSGTIKGLRIKQRF